MKYIIIPALALTLALPLQAGIRHAGGHVRQKSNLAHVFKKRDKDHDGFLTKEEFTAARKRAEKAEKAFTRKDKNADSKLSLIEFKGAKKSKAKGHKTMKPHKKARKNRKSNR